MGIFSENVTRLYESGLICIPVGDRKAPIQKEWQLYCDERPAAEVVEKWETQFKGVDRIGLCMGQSSGLVAFDFDYAFDPQRSKIDRMKFDKDLKLVEQHILRVLPQTPAIKVGKKGWTRIYKWNPQLGANSNVSADRNGVRLFDFLSWHKQTIIPPSIHSVQDGKVLSYRWVGLPLEQCLDDIPTIELDLVYEIKRIFGELRAFDDNSRHGRLFSWLMRMTVIEKDPTTLTRLLMNKDLEVNGADPKGPYLKDTSHFRSGSPETNAARWVSRVLDWKGARADIAGRQPGQVQAEVSDDVWNYFFERSFPILRKDIMSERVMVKRDDIAQWQDVVNLEGVLKAYAGAKQLPRTHVKEQLERFVFERKKVEFLCDIPKWDGKDRIAEFGKAIKTKRFTGAEVAEILKHWGSGIFRRVEDSQNQNRCILLKGPQNIGKDTWVKHMLSDFQPYFETAALSGTPKDVYELISRLYVLHIEEFDQTKNLDVAFIKSIITQASAFFRESYGRSPSRKNVAVSFITTANVDDILRDPTGNRRFLVIPVEGIDWTYPQGQSGQVLAQFQAIHAAGTHKGLPADIETKVRAILDEYTPQDPNELILEMYKQRAALMLRSSFPKTWLTSVETIDMLNDIARKVGVSLRRVQTVLKVNHLSRRTMTGVVYYQESYNLTSHVT